MIPKAADLSIHHTEFSQHTARGGIKPLNPHDVGLHVTSGPIHANKPSTGSSVHQVAPHFHNAHQAAGDNRRAVPGRVF